MEHSMTGSMWDRARVTANRPLVCACNAHEWIHRRGFGACKLTPGSHFEMTRLNYINRYSREIALEQAAQRDAG